MTSTHGIGVRRGRKNPIRVRGKTLTEWADILRLHRRTIVRHHTLGTLESIIDGTSNPGRVVKRHYGKTIKEWSAILNVSDTQVRNHLRSGALERIANGEKMPGRKVQTHFGLTRKQITERLGVTLQRVQQLVKNGTLELRLEVVDLHAADVAAKIAETDRKYKPFYSPDKTITEMVRGTEITKELMRAYLFRRKLPFRRGSCKEALMKDAYDPAKTIKEMASLSGYSYNHASRWIHSRGLAYRRKSGSGRPRKVRS